MSSPLPTSDTPRPTDAPLLFTQLSADLILRTADLVDFRVHSPILAQASPFFASMLTLPQPSAAAASSSAHDTGAGPADSETPIVPVSEDSTTLELLLRLAYPIPKPYALMAEPAQMVPALLAAAKYEMALPLETMSERLVALMPGSPLAVWAAACRADLKNVARQAAEALKTSWTNTGVEALSFMDGLGDMIGISAGDYHRLKHFLVAGGPYMEEIPVTPIPVGFGAKFSALPAWGQFPPLSPPSPSWYSTSLPPTDLICRPSSRRGPPAPYQAHQVVLCLQSPVLKARLAERRGVSSGNDMLNGSPGPSAEPLVVLDFDEETEVVFSLLKACYGDEEPVPTDLSKLAALLVACQKYEMVAIARRVREAWDRAAAHRPLEAYFVAINHGLHEYAEAAAKTVLRGPVPRAFTNVMDSAPALAYHRLLVYYDACRQNLKERLRIICDRIPEQVYYATRSSAYRQSTTTTALKQAVTDVTSAPGIPLKAECRKKITDIMLKQLDSTGFGDFLVPLIECMTSTDGIIDSAINDVQLQFA
ncbi:uncharacterized protein TRAVEDRAFT_72106 [Trametes versicolor FP-101664 SS1]|uniref:uncharacterized protein n=1 Tax=Trametes versicolor (strain FP-101664) TaxID=717944 RepID=UPI0004623784|nr:uncharacterized protein TRAVEDRAFT_72106 [Trametes versicolor FP-101664 SS1]EIW58584.1 hypothetical protein TRAVEDRAFT_72106 [Trametes versicolor FP-101664 SS1]